MRRPCTLTLTQSDADALHQVLIREAHRVLATGEDEGWYVHDLMTAVIDQAVVSGEERGELRRLRDQVADRLEGT